jgi:hypothetical protein
MTRHSPKARSEGGSEGESESEDGKYAPVFKKSLTRLPKMMIVLKYHQMTGS